MRWKQFSEHGVQSHVELANLFLKQLDGLSVIEQLKQQGIVQIIKRPLLCYGAMTVIDCQTKLVIFLLHEKGIDQWLKTMGHEIGHSFFYYKRGARIVRSCKKTDAEETFCEVFSEKWLLQNNNSLGTENLLEPHFNNENKWSYI